MRPLLAASLLICMTTVCTAQLGGAIDRLNDQLRQSQQRMKEMSERSAQMQREMEQRSKEMAGIAKGLPGFRGPSSTPGGQADSSVPRSPWEDGGSALAKGLRITPGDITPSNGERFLVRDDGGNTVVGRHHVTVGTTRVILMPDGSLRSFLESEVDPTAQEFEPMGMDFVEANLLADPRLAGFRSIRSRRFLYLHNSSDLFVRSARTILESMYPAVRKYFSRSGVDVHEPELPLVVIAFATEEEFQNYRRMPRGVVAYYDTISNAVLLYEQSNLSKHAPEIAVKNAVSTIAHEGAHQVLHNIGVQQRLSKWPLWLSEGLAEFYAPTSIAKGVRWSGLGSTNELRMYEIDKDWKTRRARTLEETIRRVVTSDELNSLDYAYSWGLIHMMSRRHRKELFACIRDCSALGPFEGTPIVGSDGLDPSAVYLEHMPDDLAETAAELTKHLQSLNYVDPIENQTHYLVLSGSSVYLTSSPDKVDELKRSSFGRFQVKRFPNRRSAQQAMDSMAK